MKARLYAAAAAMAVTTAAPTPPTSPAATTASTSTRAGVARVMWARTGTRAATVAPISTRPRKAPAAGAPPVGRNRFTPQILRDLDELSSPFYRFLTPDGGW